MSWYGLYTAIGRDCIGLLIIPLRSSLEEFNVSLSIQACVQRVASWCATGIVLRTLVTVIREKCVPH